MQHDKEKLLFRKIKKLDFIVKAKFNDKIEEDTYKELMKDCSRDIGNLLKLIGNIDKEKFDEVC